MQCSIIKNSSGDSVLRITGIISKASATPPDLANGYFGLKVRTIRNSSTLISPGKLRAWLSIPDGNIAQG